MTAIPELRDVHYAHKYIKKSTRWLYQEAHAGRIPCTRLGKNVWWTDEQIAQIIRDGAREAVKPEPAASQKQNTRTSRPPVSQKKNSQRRKSDAVASSRTDIPQADFTVSRLYRNGDAA